MQGALFILCAWLTLGGTTSASAWSLFPQKRFRYQGLVDAGSLGLSDASSGVAAWGDWNGDQYLDAFILSSDARTLNLHLWDHSAFSFASQPLFALSPSTGGRIVNVVPGDYNNDGQLDVLIMTRKEGSDSSSSSLMMEVWLGSVSQDVAIAPRPISVPSASTGAQPLLFDGLGSMRLDLLGHFLNASSDQSSQPALAMWQNAFAETNGTEAFRIVDHPLMTAHGATLSEEPPCDLADPHSSAFVDLNGDCLADLFLVCAASRGRQRFQIWTANKDESQRPAGFTFARSGLLPEGAGPLVFADMNRDGAIDVVFASCESSGCYVNVVYNRQMDLCSKHATATGGSALEETSWNWKDWWNNRPRNGTEELGRCRKTEGLCLADDDFQFDFEAGNGNETALKVPLESLLPGHRPLFEDLLTSMAPVSRQPISLSVGDFDKDGYPDLLLLSIPSNEPKNGRGKTNVHILRNIESISDSNRWFQVVREGGEVLQGIQDARSASWVDMDEDGSLDILLLRGRERDKGIRSATFVQNNFFHDAFFLKALMLNGACAATTCERPDGSRYKSRGAFLPGASYKFTVLDPNGVRRAQQVGQSPQSCYRSLSTPYSYFGLGRTNNYVETIFVGSTLHSPQHFLAMEGVIPNSQVIISPSAEVESSSPSDWKRELYLQPGDWIPWVTLVLVTIILGLCGFVFTMQARESRQDELERKQGVHAMNFDALG